MCEKKFKCNHKDYHWLGNGLYFFQDAPYRAWEWARQEIEEVKIKRAEPAVVGARIDFNPRLCIDLIDVRWQEILAEISESYLDKYLQAGIRPPRQKSLREQLENKEEIIGMPHRLDCDFLDTAVMILEENGFATQAIRAVFLEGKAILPNSHLYKRAHVQIAVREKHFFIIKECFKIPAP